MKLTVFLPQTTQQLKSKDWNDKIVFWTLMYTVGYLSMYVYLCISSENNSEDKSLLFSYHVGPDDQILVFSLGAMWLYLLSSFTSPGFFTDDNILHQL